jgi:hypothetical protein
VLFAMKFFGANILRFYLHYVAKKEGVKI